MKVSLILEDTLAAASFLVVLGLLGAVLGIDEQPVRSQRIYSTSFMKFPASRPLIELSKPLQCDATVTQASAGEMPRTRCYVRKSRRDQ